MSHRPKKSQRLVCSMLDLVHNHQHEGTTSRSQMQDATINGSDRSPMQDATINGSNDHESASNTDSDSSSHTFEDDNRDSDHESHESSDDSHEKGAIQRGQTKPKFQWGTGNIMILELNENNQVVGVMASEFATQLGVLAREGHKLPLTYVDWRMMPKKSNKDDVWDEVKISEEKGRKPNKLELFLESREAKKGQPLDEFTANVIATLKELKGKLPEEMQNDAAANDKIFDDVIGKESKGCLSCCNVSSKNEKLFASQEKFDQAVNERVTCIKKDMKIAMEHEISEIAAKMKAECLTEMKQMLHDHNLSFGNPSTEIQECPIAHRELAFNELSQGILHSSSICPRNEPTEMSKEANKSENESHVIRSDATSPKVYIHL
ncbi:OLC1v1015348C1 [Oldenlandia corymbosa var. corymbosa]|uniref:OLC1v1015348C1 n=1 Tax=Oldenlandia corymbosa var. corymbosa TaxID=529605 RepID=A0AAV1E2X4_OLDCO|nr:OLC1v1015348C1 [Oldenlandia corymbosa var. corymbosa]